MRFLLLIATCLLCYATKAQSYVFAQLNGTPVNTSGWTLTGTAAVTNVTGTGNSEILLCPASLSQNGAIFFNHPINLNLCNSWTAEFDFRIFDGTGADGIAFCLLDVPPSGFVVGGGLGIPATANGLKICFDTYLNCPSTGFELPKLEIRYGAGYDECWSQPTVTNASGNLSVIRANEYCHAKITYNNGHIQVFLNNNLVMVGYQPFNFNGYPGFTAATGGSTDNHSIKNVVIYTNMPPSEAGNDITVCSGMVTQIGTIPNILYSYSWTPSTDISSATVANPFFSFVNNTTAPVVKKLYVQTTYAGGLGCPSTDSISITVLPPASVVIATPTANICQGQSVTFTATVDLAGAGGLTQWYVNGNPVGALGDLSYTTATLNDGDVVTCSLVGNSACTPVTSNAITMQITPGPTPAVIITGVNSFCSGAAASFTAVATNGGTAPVYQWSVNGIATGGSSNTFTTNNLQDGDVIRCTLTASGGCVDPAPVVSNPITISLLPSPVVDLGGSRTICEGSSTTLQAGSFASYLWQNGSTNNNLLVTNAGTYHVTVTNSGGCKGSDTVTVSTNPKPVNFLPADAAACEFTPFTLQAGTFSSYLWSTGDITNATFIPQTGTYWLEVTDARGCIGRDSVVYSLKNCTRDIYFPTAFSPDGNGRNDIFKPIVSNVLSHYRFRVFNRWGQEVFSSTDPSRGWDGTIRGAKQASGIFVWYCSYQFEGDPVKNEKGTVLLVR